MPVPPLPLELIALILSHLGDSLDEPARRENGKQLALVCRDWKPLAYEMAFRTLTLKPKEDEGLIQFLLDHSALLTSVHTLDLTEFGPKEKPAAGENEQGVNHEGASFEDKFEWMSSNQARDFRRLITCTPLLHTLNIPPVGRDEELLSALTRTPSSDSIAVLLLEVTALEEVGLADIASHLRNLTALKRLTLRLCLIGESQSPFLRQNPAVKIPLEYLSLSIFGLPDSGLHEAVATFLSDVLDLSSLRTCRIDDVAGIPGVIAPLPHCINLKFLILDMPTAAGIAASLEYLYEALPNLSNLEQFSITSGNPAAEGFSNVSAEFESPIPLYEFLSALPSTFRSGLLTGVYFPLDPAVPDHQIRPGEDPEGPTLLSFILLEDEEGDSRISRGQFTCIEQPNGPRKWVLLETLLEDDEDAVGVFKKEGTAMEEE